MSNLIVTGGFGGFDIFDVTSVVPTSTTVTINFNAAVDLGASAELVSAWSITHGVNAVDVEIFDVEVSGASIILTTSDHTNGETYTLHMPSAIYSTTGTNFTGSVDRNYVGVGHIPTLQIIKSIDEFTLDIVFSEAMLESDATDASNYTLDGGVTVLRSEKVTDLNYRLTTTAQLENTAYNLSASGIRDLAWNQVV
jgi:hypothetical protein